jgi:glycine/D-amino acid oxidase-like deaminating enzyme
MSKLDAAQIVIVGGGAVGTGIAYALAQAGKTDVILIERRSNLSLGTSSQGAGLCGQVRTTTERTKLAMHSAKTFVELEAANAPVKPGWQPVGSLRLATTPERVDELLMLAQVSDEAGLEVELIDIAHAQRMWPQLRFDNVLSVLWCPSDGYMVPQRVVASYEYHCRQQGVRFLLDTTVQGIQRSNGRVSAVETNRGVIECEYVINAAGPFAYHVANMVGVKLPIVPVRHQYYVTEPLDGLNFDYPVLRIPDAGLYARVDGTGLLLGGWEEDCISLPPAEVDAQRDEVPCDSDGEVLASFTARFEPFLPQVVGAPAGRFAKGWPTFTPDGQFIVGECRDVPGFIMAGGCNAHGISGSPGLGVAVVEAMFSPQPSAYVRGLSPDRFLGMPWDVDAMRSRAEAISRNYYEVTLNAKGRAATSAIEEGVRIDRGQSLPPAHVAKEADALVARRAGEATRE